MFTSMGRIPDISEHLALINCAGICVVCGGLLRIAFFPLTGCGCVNILNVSFRTIAQATEDEERVRNALKFVSGLDEIEETKIDGHFGNTLIIMAAHLEKKKQVRDFLARLNEFGIIRVLVDEVEERTDEECVFRFRLDKQKAYEEILELATGKDVIDCAVKAAAYPARKENAVASVQSAFQELLNL